MDIKEVKEELNLLVVKNQLSVKTATHIVNAIEERDELVKANSVLGDVMHWVAMSKRQPEDYKRVLWFDSRDGNVQVGYFVKETQVPYATHWMELPQPPCA